MGTGIEWYSSLFTRVGNKQLCGEASTNYTRWPQVDGVPELIQQIIPNVKLIYIMRDPVERAFSHFVHRWTKKPTQESLLLKHLLNTYSMTPCVLIAANMHYKYHAI